MRITALEEYGLRCLISLAKVGLDGQLSITEIAQLEGLSIPYTSKLLSILRKTGLVKAVRGRKGGFCIARTPEEINLLEVLTALGGPLIDSNHCLKFSGLKDKCVHTNNCSVHYTLVGLSKIVEEFLSNNSLQDIIEKPALGNTTEIESKVSLSDTEISGRLNSTFDEIAKKNKELNMESN
ncbi:MAG: Rrf2 family transcriptional regulator [FCB group bacterium]|nr:Rrf2 family transcriptional regulator [FCB group bacterium]